MLLAFAVGGAKPPTVPRTAPKQRVVQSQMWVLSGGEIRCRIASFVLFIGHLGGFWVLAITDVLVWTLFGYHADAPLSVADSAVSPVVVSTYASPSTGSRPSVHQDERIQKM